MRRDEFSVGDLVLAALLLGIGSVLHAVFPGVFAGMKPDFSLIMLFVVIMLIPDKRIVAIAGIATGLITALTTTFPGGQIPNIIDKLVTTAAVMALASVIPSRLKVPVVGVLGTLVSGVVFLSSATVLVGLPAPFMALVVSVVLPATAINTLSLLVLYPITAKLYSAQRHRVANPAKAGQ